MSTAFHAVLSRAALWWMTAIYWPDFQTFTYLSHIWYPQWGGYPQSIKFIFGTEKLEWLGQNLVKVERWLTQSFGHNTSTWQTHRQPRRHSKCCTNARHRAANKCAFIRRLNMQSHWPNAQMLVTVVAKLHVPVDTLYIISEKSLSTFPAITCTGGDNEIWLAIKTN